MTELLEKAFALSISMMLIVLGVKMSQTTLFPEISTATTLIQYNALVERFRNALHQASTSPVRLQFYASIPPGFLINVDGDILILELETSFGRRTDRIKVSMQISILGSVQSGDVTVVIDSTNGDILIEIGGM